MDDNKVQNINSEKLREMKHIENIHIAIPSYKRCDAIQKKTLKTLDRHNVPSEQVEIFVANQEEFDQYTEALKDNRYQNITIGVPQIGMQRNWIERYLPEGTWLVMIDDDIEEVEKKVGEQDLAPVEDLMELFYEFFVKTAEAKANTWGLYPVHNAFFMKDRMNEKLTYIIACLTGVIVDHDPELARTLHHAEDNEFSIRSFIKYGKVCRFEGYTMKTKFYTEPGGLQEFRTAELIKSSVLKLEEMFPDYCTSYVRASTGNYEIKFKQPKFKDENQTSLF